VFVVYKQKPGLVLISSVWCSCYNISEE